MTLVRFSIQSRALHFAAGILLAVMLVHSGAAYAQLEGGAGAAAPPPPPGPGEIVVQLISEDPQASLSGVSIVLYSLASNGSPGLVNGETDAQGRATFSGISNAPNIVYLVGARYAQIPFGERVSFPADRTDAAVTIKVSKPTGVVSGVTIDEFRMRLDWTGGRILVTEKISLTSSGSRVIQLPASDPSAAIIQRPLPSFVKDFAPGPNSMGDELAIQEGSLRFTGPLYPGVQQIEYQYSFPADASDTPLQLPIELHQTASRVVVVVAGTSGIQVEGPGLGEIREIASEMGERLSSWTRGALLGGERFEIAMTLPEGRTDPSLLSIPRSDVVIDLDDIRVNANVDLQLTVEPGAPVVGTAERPLMHIALPAGATLERLTPEAEILGIIRKADGSFDVIGPIGAGQHKLAYSYRIPSHPEGVEIGMTFPLEIETLNILIADTGVALDSSRLHRRRPFRNGTRNYLHREAFNVSPDEVVDLALEPLRATGIPQQASIAITIAAVAGATLFLMAPLRKVARLQVVEDPKLIALRDAREAMYASIGDLDHDFETGKLEASDHAEMRADLVAQAIELLRRERALGNSPSGTTDLAAASAGADAVTQNAHATPSLCPECHGEVHPGWKFCTHCGGSLNPDAGTTPSDAADAPLSGETPG
jgi:hypothetical protein